MTTKRPFVTFGLAAAALAALAGVAEACPRDRAMAGVVQRVTGQRGEVYIERTGTDRIRPAPMETLCEGDVVVANPQASITLRLDGASTSTLLQGPGRFTLPPNARRANVVDNALQLLLETWMPDIKRSSNFGVVRGRLGEPPEWATPGLADGLASIRRGSRSLLLLWSGDPGLYRVEVADADGQIVEKAQVNKTEVRLPSRNWSGGPYTVRIYQGTSKTAALTGRFRAGDAPPRNPHDFPGSMGEEVRAVSEALRIASLDPERWTLEAIQLIDRAPAQGLDRDVLFRSLAPQTDQTADGTAN